MYGRIKIDMETRTLRGSESATADTRIVAMLCTEIFVSTCTILNIVKMSIL